MIDVSLVPLIPSKFNSLKSELKLIEAGMFRRPVIASYVQPYKPFLKHKKTRLSLKPRPTGLRGSSIL